MNALAFQMIDQLGIFNASHAVPDPGGLKLTQRFPNTIRSTSFAGMGRAIEAVIDRITEGRNLRVYRITGFVARDIERGDAAASKLLHQIRCHNTLLPIEVAERTQNEPGLDAAGSDAGFCRAIYSRHHLLGR